MISSIPAIAPAAASPVGVVASDPSGPFGGMLDAASSAVDSADKMQDQAASAVEAFVSGETDDISGVMAAVEKGELAFKTLLAVRSKLMTAYDEIRNMPV
jgi:flagellar hook-basal body complex protein FliE